MDDASPNNSGNDEFNLLSDSFTEQTEQAESVVEMLPCVGCGWCCLDHPCDQSVHKYGYTKVCPELMWHEEDTRYYCKLYFTEETRAYIKEAQRIGQGCCAPQNNWRKNVRRRD